MAVASQRAFARSLRRVRLTFDGALGAGAFASSWFTVVAVDAWGASVAVVEALAVASRPNDLELALSRDLTPGAHYRIDIAAGIPDAEADPSPSGSVEAILGTPQRQASRDRDLRAVIDSIFQHDAAHDGDDFVEGASGDLESVTGEENGRAAVRRRVAAQGLRWDSTYGPGVREFVDAPVTGLYAVRGSIAENLRLDDRVRNVDVVVGDATVDGDDVQIPVSVEFVGGVTSTVEVPLG